MTSLPNVYYINACYGKIVLIQYLKLVFILALEELTETYKTKSLDHIT